MIFQLIVDTPSNAIVEPATSVGVLWPAITVLGLVVLVVLGIAFQKLLHAMRRPEMYGLTPEKVRETWEQIEQMSGQGAMGAKLAVIEADKLLDGVLRSLIFPGETMGERLKSAQYKFKDINKVWPAHKLRNQLVHDSTFELTIPQAKRALKDFEAALRTLHVL
ncbi:MAG TPA: hypothetical protein VMU11_02050 [Verrucomicrobiae bacterium]|nr:hypothetical protein [Verrucomicrobiae bacterium]